MKRCDRVLVAFLAPPRNLAVHSIFPQFGSFLDPYSILLSLKISNLQMHLDMVYLQLEMDPGSII